MPPLAGRQGRVGRSSSRVGLILPYGIAPGLEPAAPLWESLVAVAPRRPQVYGLALPWGIIHERTLYGSPAFMAHGLGISEREAAEDSVVRLRAWLDTFGPGHQELAAVVGGPLMPMWNRAVAGAPIASRIRLLALPVRGRGNPWAPIRHKLGVFMAKAMRGGS